MEPDGKKTKYEPPTSDNFLKNHKMLNMDALLYYYECETDNDMKYLLLKLLERIQIEYNEFELGGHGSTGTGKLP